MEIINNTTRTLKDDLSKEEKKDLLGIIGTLDEVTLKDLIYEVLNPIGYNLIVTLSLIHI